MHALRPALRYPSTHQASLRFLSEGAHLRSHQAQQQSQSHHSREAPPYSIALPASGQQKAAYMIEYVEPKPYHSTLVCPVCGCGEFIEHERNHKPGSPLIMECTASTNGTHKR